MNRTDRTLRLLLPLTLLLGMLAGMLGPRVISGQAAPEAQTATHVVISEFRTLGPIVSGSPDSVGESNEFIEIFNPTASVININGWKITMVDDVGAQTAQVIFNSGNTMLPPNERRLIVNVDGERQRALPRDWTFSGGIPNNGGIGLWNEAGVRVDSVAMSSVDLYREGTPLASMTDPTRSYQRQGNGSTDTDDNSADFVLGTPDPQTSAASAVNAEVVISEFRTRGPEGDVSSGQTADKSEFIELFNRTGMSIDIGGWSIKATTGAGTDAGISFTTLDPETILDPGQYYLIVNQDAPDGLFNISDWDYSGDIPNNGGIALLDAGSQEVDAVGMSTNASGYFEGTALIPMTSPTDTGYIADQSYARGGGGCTDAGNNATDFTLAAPSNPQEVGTISPCSFIVGSTTTITSVSSSTSIVGQSYTVNFSVAANSGSSIPTGTVMVDDGTDSCGPVTLINGTGSCNLTSNTSGSKTLTATYSGSNTFLEGTSAGVAHTVNQIVLTQTVPPLAVIINEVAWAGTAAFPNDEWIELYNPGVNAISLTGWSLKTRDGNVSIVWNATSSIANDPNDQVIEGGSYYLIERDDDNTVYDVKADKFYTSTASDSLVNGGATLELFDPQGTRIDTANVDGGSWPAGSAGTGWSTINFRSMERYRVILDSATSWVSNTGVVKNGIDSGIPSGCTTNCNTAHRPIIGTPKNRNWAATVTLTPTPRPPTPVPTRTKPPQPRPVINEFLPRAAFDWNQDGKVDVYDEFVEVANIGPVDWNTGGWKLDTGEDSEPFALPQMVVKPGGRALFYARQSGLRLTDGGATLRLLNNTGKIYDAQTYTVVKTPDKSWCRIKDLSGSWFDDCFPTPNFPNTREGELPSLPPGTGLESPLCRLADTLPEDFVLAECSPYGEQMWNSLYWDQSGWTGEQPVPQDGSKWDVYIE